MFLYRLIGNAEGFQTDNMTVCYLPIISFHQITQVHLSIQIKLNSTRY